MSYESAFNQKTRDDFKNSINYSVLAESGIHEKKIIMDWPVVFQKITDTEGNEWSGTLNEPDIGQLGEGEVSGSLKSSKGTAIVTIASLSGSWRQRLDYLVWKNSLTNRHQVNLKVVPGIEDLYLVTKDGDVTASVVFLYGCFYISVSSWDGNDINALAKAIHKILESHNQPEPATAKASFKITTDKSRPKTGDTLALTVEGLVQHWHSQWVYKQAVTLLDDNVEYIEQDGNKFLFKVIKPGTIKIPFTALHKTTLLTEQLSVTLEVN